MDTSYRAQLDRILELNGIRFSDPEISDRLVLFADLLLKENQVQNLTAITDPEKVAVRHLTDSLMVLPALPGSGSVADVGCGGGFPLIPAAIAAPHLSFTGIDSTAKKIRFVMDAAKALNLANVSGITGRAEEFGQAELRERFDAVMSRAVASLPVLCELCLPLVRTGGSFIALKGNAKEELEQAVNAIRILGGELETVREYDLIGETEPLGRSLITIRKVRPTPNGYPRMFSKIKSKPLI